MAGEYIFKAVSPDTFRVVGFEIKVPDAIIRKSEKTRLHEQKQLRWQSIKVNILYGLQRIFSMLIRLFIFVRQFISEHPLISLSVAVVVIVLGIIILSIINELKEVEETKMQSKVEKIEAVDRQDKISRKAGLEDKETKVPSEVKKIEAVGGKKKMPEKTGLDGLKDRKVILALCQQAIDQKNYDAAITYCDQALESNPRHAVAWNNKGVALSGLGQHLEAAKCYKKALDITPNDPVIKNNARINENVIIGGWEADLEEIEQLTRKYVKAVRIEKSNTWISQGNDFYKAGNYSEALRCFDQALSWDPNSVHALFNRCLSLQMLGRNDEASISCDQAIEANSECVRAGGNENKCFNKERIVEIRKTLDASQE